MDETKMFRILFTYVSRDENLGKDVKAKKEILALCSSYTEAEQLSYRVMEDLRQYSEDVDYEIKRINKRPDIALTQSLETESSEIMGLINSFLVEENDDLKHSFFNVSVEWHESTESGAVRKTNENWLIPAANSREAYDSANKMLKKLSINDFVLKNIKFDAADELFMPPSYYQSYVRRSEHAGLL